MSRLSFIAVFALTIATLVLAVLMGSPPIPELRMAEGFQTPILALEFARSAEDVAFLQGEGAAGLRAALVRIQALDQYFPIAYAGMAAMLFLGLALRGSKWALVAVVIAIVTIPADWVENLVVDQIINCSGNTGCTTDLPDHSADSGTNEHLAYSEDRIASNVAVLQLITWIKWGLIGLYAALMSILMLQDRRRILAIPGAVAALAVAATWLSGSSGVVAELMAVALLPFMLSFPLAAAMYLFKPNSTE